MENKHIGWIRVLLLIIPYFFIVGGFQLIGAWVAGIQIDPPNVVKSSGQQLITSSFNLLGNFLLLWIFMRFVDKEKFVSLGFHIKNRGKEIVGGIVLGAFIMGFAYVTLLLLSEIEFVKLTFSIRELFISILIFLIVAIVEEVLLRGYVLRNFMISFNKYIALILSSAIFALLHGFNPNISWFSMVVLFLAGLLLGISYVYTKNLWFPIALHFSWNFFQTHFGFNVSGLDMYSIIETQIVENNLLNGGAFGFEGSIFSVIAEIGGIIAIGYYFAKKVSVIPTPDTNA
ncbi:CPBP family intramembrane glutamic endopeptidase [Aquimarina spongiae]|uniref:CAAX prenyl protease 2/Lysostaphin resistance protein A-like domain-containing protein n=1 Tax=Aquimarina spongiae TaxID=570521 RepID=A0A1M6ALA3_9FLAO|nr:CPBP family intramembrane glutamic endopeptidase [Aquimarina spongiae]SHI37246.1 hypothetical protein SAMN04488508_101353 [Aquimarina spongiae]